MKGRDLILAKGYSQSNHARWCTIGWPTTPNWRRQLGAVGVAGALRYMGMVLHFWCFLFLQNQWSARNSPRGSSTGGGSRAGCAVARFKPQPSVMVGECSKCWLTTRFGQSGVARNVEHCCWVDGTRGASHTAW
jgi:hypothetical protein